MSENTEIRRYPDGSIDTAYYTRLGRRLHAQAIHHAARGVVKLLMRVRSQAEASAQLWPRNI